MRIGAGWTAAVLLAGLSASAASAQGYYDGDLHSASPKPKSWFENLYSSAPATKPPDKKGDDVEPPTPVGPSPVQLASASRQRERAALDRRNEVCDRLMEIAVRNNDEAMQTQIEQLRDRAWDIYQQRTAGLSSPGPMADPADEKPTAAKPSPKREVKP
jgi:hypothetical protein